MWKAIILVLIKAALEYLLDYLLDPVMANKCKLIMSMVFAVYGICAAIYSIYYQW